MIKQKSDNLDPVGHLSTFALLRIADVMRLTGFRSRDQIYKLVRRGDLSPPVKIGLRASAWRASDVVSFIESRQPAPPFGAKI